MPEKKQKGDTIMKQQNKQNFFWRTDVEWMRKMLRKKKERKREKNC